MNFSLPNFYGALNVGPNPQGVPSIVPSMTSQPASGAGTQKKNCNCKNSRCLKLYCECFSSGEYCKNCNCNGCCNNIENESIRKKTIAEVLERNPNAFRPKIAASAPPQQSPIVPGPGPISHITNSLISGGSLNMGNIAIDNIVSAIPINQQSQLELTPKGTVSQGKHSKVSQNLYLL